MRRWGFLGLVALATLPAWNAQASYRLETIVVSSAKATATVSEPVSVTLVINGDEALFTGNLSVQDGEITTGRDGSLQIDFGPISLVREAPLRAVGK